jgi:hemerythrin superfamily protein
MNPKADAAKSDDALAILKRDHEQVQAMFEQYEALGARAHAGKRKLADQICRALSLHAELEEACFYPALRGAGKDYHEMVDEALVEHAAAKELIGQIGAMDTDEELFDAKVKVLGEQVAHHVKEEEGELFPKARQAKLDLAEIGREMAQRKAQAGADAA